MRRPTGADAHAVQWFARECQIAAGVFVDPADSLEVLEAVHRALAACPDTLSAIYMSRIVVPLVGTCRQAVRFSRRPLSAEPAGRPSARRRAAQVLDRVLALHSQPSLTLRQIAATLGRREQYLSQALNDVSRRKFTDHLNAIRLLHAVALLADTRDTVDSVALECGYACPEQLNRVFRNRLHVTPTRLRRLLDVENARRTKLQRNSS
jgi:AraC-like DNA-binding protein